MTNRCVKELVDFINVLHILPPTCFDKRLPSSGGRRCLISYWSNVCVVGMYELWSVQFGQLSRNVHWTWQPLAETCCGKLWNTLIKSTKSLTHLLVILQRYGIVWFVDRASRYMRVMKPNWCNPYLQFIRHCTSTCFGLARWTSSGGKNVYMWQLVRVVSLKPDLHIPCRSPAVTLPRPWR
jgi:hypothetical protein